MQHNLNLGQENKNMATWTTKFINNLPDSSFAFILPGGFKDKSGKTIPRSNRLLPYKDENGNPDAAHVRNALSRLPQSEVPKSKQPDVKKMLQNVLDKLNAKNASENLIGVDRLSKLITIAANDAGELPEEIEVLMTGMWDAPYHGVFMITPQDLQQYVDNFNADVRASSSSIGLPIDYEHDADGGAAGWITGLRIGQPSDPTLASQGIQSLWASVTWTPPGAEAVQGGVYKFISPEFCPEGYIDPEGQLEPLDNVFIGAGLTNRPLLKGLQPVSASERSQNVLDNATENNNTNDKLFINIKANQKEGERQVDLSQILQKDPADLSDQEKQTLADHKDELSADQVAKFGLDGSASSTEDETSEDENTNTNTNEENEEEEVNTTQTTTQPVAASEGNIVISKSELESLKASAANGELAHQKLQRAEAADHVDSLCFNEQTGVRVKPELRDSTVDLYVSMNDKQRTAFDKLMEGVTPVADRLQFNETGKGTDPGLNQNSAYNQVKEAADKLVTDGKAKNFGEAVQSVMASDKALAGQYEKEVYGGSIKKTLRTAGAR